MKPGWIVLGVLAIVWSGVANAQPARWQDEAERRLSDIRERAGAELGDPAVQRELKSDLDGMLTVMGKLGSPRDENLLLDIAETRRILTIATTAPDAEAADWYRYLADESKLGRTLAFVLSPEDEPVGVIRVLRELRDEFGDSALDEFPELVAAICVVHDGEELFARQVNENRPRTPGVVPLFDFFSANEDRMLFGVREIPAELLIYVVDIVGDIEEFEWALDNYAGDQLVGRLFNLIEYDREHAENGTPKDVTRHGYTLPGIQEFGGVCADQAHFAVTVGKSIGVPTAYVTAVGGEVGHAWVGFLEAEGRNAFWNLDIGRYEEYKGVVGDVLDPQTRRTIGDDELSLLSRLTRVNRNQRFEAAAWLDTAALLQRGARTIDIGQSKSRTTPREGQAGVLEL
ncbi:MAG: transglutaminase domain-containing protein, partial [Phycisphaerales bacterium]|nr:transglutaminase domain-containing protein [Phycisphaerales bacterium]